MIVHPRIEMGRERVPLLVIDDAHDSVARLQEAARAASFGRSEGDHYPGVRAAAPPEYGQWLEALATQATGAAGARIVRTSFAIATDKPAALVPIQRIPHFDTLDPMLIAAVHYLCAPPHAGTAFYRHKRTGFERIDASRHPAWRQGLAGDVRDYGVPQTPCATRSSAAFELIELAELRLNRLILYPANCLHSGIVAPDAPCAAPSGGRVTITSLLQVTPQIDDSLSV